MKGLFDFFQLSRKERKGFLFLLVLLGLFAIFPVFRIFFRPDEPLNYELIAFEREKEVGQVEHVEDALTYMGLLANDVSPKEMGKLFEFDPNGLPVESWKRLGLSEKQIRVIKNYESKGGRFTKKEDVKKLYSISEDFYNRIEPYIVISTTRSKERSIEDFKEGLGGYSADKPVANTTLKVEINLADTTEWKKLRGIGSVYAARIVRFRESLGGFAKEDQIKEVYGISEELYESIRPALYLGKKEVNKIAINSATKEQLQKHPYISPKQADVIIKFRNQHGTYSSLDNLRKIMVLDQNFFAKIEPYLDFES